MVSYNNICLFCLRALESRPAEFLEAALVRLDCENLGVMENMGLCLSLQGFGTWEYARCIEFGVSTGIV